MKRCARPHILSSNAMASAFHLRLDAEQSGSRQYQPTPPDQGDLKGFSVMTVMLSLGLVLLSVTSTPELNTADVRYEPSLELFRMDLYLGHEVSVRMPRAGMGRRQDHDFLD